MLKAMSFHKLRLGHRGWLLSHPRPPLLRHPRHPRCLRVFAGRQFRNVNRLAPDSDDSGPGYRTDATDSVDYVSAWREDPNQDNAEGRSTGLSQQWAQWQASWEELKGNLLYRYYNWRQDTWSDLQLFALFNLILFVVGSWIEGAIIRQLDGTAPRPPSETWWGGFWDDFYAIMIWVLGQDLPRGEEAGLASQVFAVLTVTLGLASFALVLALIEQVVLEVLESNVKRGSQVFERGHVVVLAWGESSTDMSQLGKMLQQLCYANAGRADSVVVVLTASREKLEMEQVFREAMPVSERMGTRFVFRQGSPLDPAALRLVGADKARAVIVSGDGARNALDSDAQCMRAAVLLDEAAANSPGRGPNIVVQIKSPDTLPVLRYSCSPRVIPVPTFLAQARRIVRLLRHPITALFGFKLTDYRSEAHATVHEYPQLVGIPFGKLHFYFPNAMLVGFLNESTGYCKINPQPSRVMGPGDSLIMLRPGPAGQCAASTPLAQPVQVGLGGWDPTQYNLDSTDEEPLGVVRQPDDANAAAAPKARRLAEYVSHNAEPGTDEDEPVTCSAPVSQSQKGLYILPLQFTSSLLPTSELLICGWGRKSFMWTLLQELDHGPQALPPNATVTLVNNHDTLPGMGPDGTFRSMGITNLNVRHVKVDPRSRTALQRAVDISKFKAAVVLCDLHWSDVGSGSLPSQHKHVLTQAEMLRLDAAVLLVQMNIRYLLEEMGLPDISIIVEKNTYIGETRFEDAKRLPLGIPINTSSFCAKTLTTAAMDPRYLKPYSELGYQSDLVVQDSSAFAAVGEELSYWQLQARAAAVQQCVLGYYRIPPTAEEPLGVVVNPQGVEARSQRVILNLGDSRCKVVTLALNKAVRSKALSSSSSSTLATVTSKDMEDHHQVAHLD